MRATSLKRVKTPKLLRPALWLAALAAAGCGGVAPDPAGPLRQYPHSAAFDAIAQAHADAPADRDELILLTTWFQDGDPGVAVMCRVRADGHVFAYRYLHAGALNDPRSLQLAPGAMSALRETIEALPESQSPPLPDLLIVTFRRNGQWATRTYDRARRPEAVSALFALTGSPIDPAASP